MGLPPPFGNTFNCLLCHSQDQTDDSMFSTSDEKRLHERWWFGNDTKCNFPISDFLQMCFITPIQTLLLFFITLGLYIAIPVYIFKFITITITLDILQWFHSINNLLQHLTLSTWHMLFCMSLRLLASPPSDYLNMSFITHFSNCLMFCGMGNSAGK